MRARLPLLALLCFLPACAMERSPSLTAPPVGARTVRLCGAVDGTLRDFTGWIDPATGDTLVSGKRFHELFPAAYAGGERWFERREGLPGHLRRYMPYGIPRTLSSEDLRDRGLEVARRVGDIEFFSTLPRHRDGERALHEGGMFDEEILYVLVHPGCLFQPYQNMADYGWVRDGEAGR